MLPCYIVLPKCLPFPVELSANYTFFSVSAQGGILWYNVSVIETLTRCLKVTQEDIVAKLSAVGIRYEDLDGVLFRGSGGDMGEFLTGFRSHISSHTALGVVQIPCGHGVGTLESWICNIIQKTPINGIFAQKSSGSIPVSRTIKIPKNTNKMRVFEENRCGNDVGT